MVFRAVATRSRTPRAESVRPFGASATREPTAIDTLGNPDEMMLARAGQVNAEPTRTDLVSESVPEDPALKGRVLGQFDAL
ncbi:MAG: hypothetical protein WCH74_10330 [Chloroflexota bacterium]